jgi:hypothetical protein
MRKRYVRWHSRTVPARWLVLDESRTYRVARDADMAPGERLMLMAENDLLTRGFEPDPPRDVPPAVYPARP